MSRFPFTSLRYVILPAIIAFTISSVTLTSCRQETKEVKFTAAVAMANSICPKEISPELSMTSISSDSQYVTYTYLCSNSSAFEATKNIFSSPGAKIMIAQSLVNSNDTKEFVDLILDTDRGLRIKLTTASDSAFIVIDRDELASMVAGNQ